MLKISQFRVVNSSEMHLKNAAGEPLFFGVDMEQERAQPRPVIVELYGPGSEAYQQAQLRAQRRVMELSKKSRNALTERSVEERAADIADLLADITIRFDGLDTEGQSLGSALRQLYSDPQCGYIVDQINSFAADWANFTPSAQLN